MLVNLISGFLFIDFVCTLLSVYISQLCPVPMFKLACKFLFAIAIAI